MHMWVVQKNAVPMPCVSRSTKFHGRCMISESLFCIPTRSNTDITTNYSVNSHQPTPSDSPRRLGRCGLEVKMGEGETLDGGMSNKLFPFCQFTSLRNLSSLNSWWQLCGPTVGGGVGEDLKKKGGAADLSLGGGQRGDRELGEGVWGLGVWRGLEDLRLGGGGGMRT